MKTFTRDLDFVNFTDKDGNEFKDLDFVKFNGVTVYEAWKELTKSGVPPITLLKCKGVDDGKYLLDYKIYGNSVQGKLPSEYQQVEYIQSTGTQIIDTGIKANLETKIIFDYQFPQFSNVAGSGRLFGCRTGENISAFICGASNGLAQETVNLFTQFDNIVSTTIIKPLIDTNRHVIELSKNGAYYDSELWRTIDNATEFTTRENIVLFGMWNTADTTKPSSGGMYRLYSCKFYENEVLVRDFIPCYRISDNVIGLYDLVNSKFYTNTGTGAFLKGTNTPTPDTPIEVESVGEKTRNLITATDGYIVKHAENRYIKYDAKTQVFTIHGSGFLTYVYLPETIPSGTTTSIFVEIVNDDYEFVKGGLVIGGYGIVSSWQNDLGFTATSQKKQSGVRTITKDTDKICIFVDANASVKNVQVRITYAVYDKEFTEYEPYGYKIPVKVRGNNSFDKNNANVIGAYINVSKNQVGYPANDSKLIVAPCKPNTTYTVSYDYSSIINSIFRTGYVTVKDITAQTWTDIYGYDYTVNTNHTITTGENATFIVIQTGNSVYETIKETLQIDETLTTNIYLNEPLRKIGDYADYIDFEKGKVIRNVKSRILTSDLGWITAYNGISKNYYHYCIVNDITQNISNDLSLLCSHYLVNIRNTSGIDNRIGFRLNLNGFFITDSTYTNVEEFISFIEANDIEVVYPSYSEETIELPNIPTNKGTTIIEVDTNILPSNMEVKYMGKE